MKRSTKAGGPAGARRGLEPGPGQVLGPALGWQVQPAGHHSPAAGDAPTYPTGHNGAMNTFKQTLQADLTTAIRSRDTLTAATLRMALTAVSFEEVAGRSARELSDTEVVAVLSTQAKRRREAAAAFTDGGRPELAEREQAELAVLVGYLPEPMTQAEVAALVEQAVSTAAAAGVTGMPAMGRVMKDLSAQTSGRFDGGELAGLVRAALR